MNGPLPRWYAPRHRAYPWRGARPDPYRVLVSEVMLQQTQAARVAPAFRSFIRRFPTVAGLAEASRGEVVRAWSGLGYNRRAVALWRAARAIVSDHGGHVPADPAVLVGLPGVGPYTASAVASIGYGAPIPAIDTNVSRVVARAALGVEPGQAPAGSVGRAARAWLDGADPAAWNQAVMDLGRELCRPRPRCERCPLASACAFRRLGRSPAPAGRRQPAFEGSSRQVRGTVVEILRGRREATMATLVRACGFPPWQVHRAVVSLERDGLVSAGPAALAGRASGRVRLAE